MSTNEHSNNVQDAEEEGPSFPPAVLEVIRELTRDDQQLNLHDLEKTSDAWAVLLQRLVEEKSTIVDQKYDTSDQIVERDINGDFLHNLVEAGGKWIAAAIRQRDWFKVDKVENGFLCILRLLKCILQKKQLSSMQGPNGKQLSSTFLDSGLATDLPQYLMDYPILSQRICVRYAIDFLQVVVKLESFAASLETSKDAQGNHDNNGDFTAKGAMVKFAIAVVKRHDWHFEKQCCQILADLGHPFDIEAWRVSEEKAPFLSYVLPLIQAFNEAHNVVGAKHLGMTIMTLAGCCESSTGPVRKKLYSALIDQSIPKKLVEALKRQIYNPDFDAIAVGAFRIFKTYSRGPQLRAQIMENDGVSTILEVFQDKLDNAQKAIMVIYDIFFHPNNNAELREDVEHKHWYRLVEVLCHWMSFDADEWLKNSDVRRCLDETLTMLAAMVKDDVLMSIRLPGQPSFADHFLDCCVWSSIVAVQLEGEFQGWRDVSLFRPGLEAMVRLSQHENFAKSIEAQDTRDDIIKFCITLVLKSCTSLNAGEIGLCFEIITAIMEYPFDKEAVKASGFIDYCYAKESERYKLRHTVTQKALWK